jgi:hypothetical protein
MKKHASLILVGLLAVSMFALVACDDEPTQEEANKEFCDDMGEFVASLRVIEDLNSDSTIEEVEGARERTRTAYSNLLESAVGVVEVQIDDLQDAYDELLAAVDAIDDEATIAEALDSVDDEISNVATEAGIVFNDVDCENASSDQKQSNE